jgi:hypothetical protein
MRPNTPAMVDDATLQCIESCLELSTAAGAAATHCMRWGGGHARPGRVNSLVTCSAVTRMIAERLQAEEPPDETLLALGIEVARNTGRICTELDDPELRPCELAASACVEALRALQAID